MNNERRTKKTIMLSKSEVEKIDRCAKRTNLKRSSYMRECILGKLPGEFVNPDITEALNLLRKIQLSMVEIAVNCKNVSPEDKKKYWECMTMLQRATGKIIEKVYERKCQ